MSIRICVDARWLETGIGTYTSNLVQGLSRRADINLSAITLPKHRATLASYSDDVRTVDAAMYSIEEQFSVPRAVGDRSMFHVPHYNVPLLYNGTLFVTIHDLTHILDQSFRHTLKSRAYARPMLQLSARKASHIITVSEYSKRQIVDYLGVPEEKVTVIYNGIGPQFYPEPRGEAFRVMQRECGVGSPYILFVGNLKPHKNVEGLLHSFSLLHQRGVRDFELVILGDDAVGSVSLRQLAERLGINSVVRFIARVNEAILRCAYSAAELTILPSFEEGFGLPVVESMACGTPVACSSAASLPEIGGDAAVYFTPTEEDAMAEAMLQILHDSSIRDHCRTRGFANTKRFDWSVCVSSHVDVYRQFASSPA